jgi:indolepyruvate decarboxylase
VTVAAYIVARLREAGVDTLFGVPGATCDAFFDAAAAGGLRVVVCSSDLEAGYAADGYARVRGMGAVAVTYGVGTLSLAPAIAGALAERVPLVLLNGGPTPEDLRIERDHASFATHSTGRPGGDLAVFRELTVAAARIESAGEAPRQIDRALATARTTPGPAYIEVARHLWRANVPAPGGRISASPSPTGREAEVAATIAERLAAARRPLVICGAEIARFGIHTQAEALMTALGLPWACTLLGRTAIDERTPGFVGCYPGSQAMPAVARALEQSDLVLALGCVFGRQLRNLATRRGLLRVDGGSARMGGEAIPVALPTLVGALQKLPWTPRVPPPGTGLSFDERRASLGGRKGGPAEAGLGYDEVLRAVSNRMGTGFTVLTDTSLSMFPAAEIGVVEAGTFLCDAVWQAIGWSVGAAVGAGMAGTRRPVVICGDGGFQMTAQALSTLARHRVRAIVLVLDNGSYAIEQWLLGPAYFDAASNQPKAQLGLHRWGYAALARALGVSLAERADSLATLEAALDAATAAAGPALVHVELKPHDLPSQLRAAR